MVNIYIYKLSQTWLLIHIMSMTCDDDEKVVLVLILCTRKTTAPCDVSLVSI